MRSGLQCDTAPRHRYEDLFYRLGRRAQPLLHQDVTCFIEHAIKARPVAQIQTDGQVSVLLVECLLHHLSSKRHHFSASGLSDLDGNQDFLGSGVETWTYRQSRVLPSW